MAFKGKSTIELRNAATGALEFKTEDENMVTNAAYNLINGFCRKDQLHPLKDNCFAGLFLFENNIQEDVNKIIADDNNMIGKAAGVYSGSDYTMGTLNITETTELENGKKYVWDFPTDRSNGTIRSVALTSPIGGNIGYKVPDEYFNANGWYFLTGSNDASPLTSNGSISTYSCVTDEVPNAYSNYAVIGIFGDKTILCRATSGSNTITFCIRTTTNKAGLTYWKKQNFEEKTITCSNKLCESNGVFYQDGKYWSIYVASATTFEITTFNADTYQVEDEFTVTCQDTSFNTGTAGVLFKDHYYIKETTKNYFYKINKDDPADYTPRVFDATVTYGTYNAEATTYFPGIYNGLLIFTGTYTGNSSINTFKTLIWDGEKKTNVKFSGGGYYIAGIRVISNTDIKPPFVPLYMSGPKILYAIFTPFLSTINNLSTPVVKNETQTMKVTYEITEI